jgi:monoterpene epsilon-lactone hydrolase
VRCDAVDCDGVPGEWSLAPGSDPSRVVLYFHGGGYCSGSLLIWPHMIHARPVWNAALEDGRRALDSAGRFIRARTERAVTGEE